jgi:hypothetical protein
MQLIRAGEGTRMKLDERESLAQQMGTPRHCLLQPLVRAFSQASEPRKPIVAEFAHCYSPAKYNLHSLG